MIIAGEGEEGFHEVEMPVPMLHNFVILSANLLNGFLYSLNVFLRDYKTI